MRTGMLHVGVGVGVSPLSQKKIERLHVFTTAISDGEAKGGYALVRSNLTILLHVTQWLVLFIVEHVVPTFSNRKHARCAGLKNIASFIAPIRIEIKRG